MRQLKVFISYRQDGDMVLAALVDTTIELHFRRRADVDVAVFRDTRIRAGTRWPDEISQQLADSDVVVVIIGPKWLDARDKSSNRRIDQHGDWVRQEIEMALQGRKTIIPVVYGADSLPRDADLPDSIVGLKAWQTAVIQDQRMTLDLERLMVRIEDLADQRPETPSPSRSSIVPYPPDVVRPAAIADQRLAQVLLAELPDWRIEMAPLAHREGRAGKVLRRDFTFREFLDVIEFMSELARHIDNTNHHPIWDNFWKNLTVRLTSVDIGDDVTDRDVDAARYYERRYREYCERAPALDRD